MAHPENAVNQLHAMKHEAKSNSTVPIKLLITKQLNLATSTNSSWWL